MKINRVTQNFLDFFKAFLKKNILIDVNYSQPLEIDGKVNLIYFYNISANTEVVILDNLEACPSQVIYDIYWQNDDNTSTFTLSHGGNSITLDGAEVDLTLQNHITLVRSPGSSGNDIGSVLEVTNNASLTKRTIA